MFLFVMPVLILGVHEVAGRSLAGGARRYTEAGAYCLIAAVVTYAWGLSHTFTMDLLAASAALAALAHLSFVTPVNLNRSDTS